jgi:DNA-3-methyladenine glycosylase II
MAKVINSEKVVSAGKNAKPLNERSLARAVRYLAGRDPALAKIVNNLGPPPLWAREQGFHTLIHIILEQQVSLSSARAAYDRLLAVAHPLNPERFLQLGDVELKSIGFSRQKTAYGRNLARSIIQGELNIEALAAMDDALVRAELTRIKGIGNWTADIYLLMVLGRRDIWPRGDLALAVAIESVKGLGHRPTPEEVEALGVDWQPWRAVAARILWHYYLSNGSPARSKTNAQVGEGRAGL